MKEIISKIIKQLRAIDDIDDRIEIAENELKKLDILIDSKLGRNITSNLNNSIDPELTKLSIDELALRRESLSISLKAFEAEKKKIIEIESILANSNIEQHEENKQDADVDTIDFLLNWLKKHNINEDAFLHIENFFEDEKYINSIKLDKIENYISELSDLSENFLEEYPVNQYNYYLLSSLYRTQDNVDEEESVLKKLQKIIPQNINIYILLSNVSMQKEQTSQAIEWINIGLETTEQGNLELLFRKARLLSNLHRFKDQLETLDTILNSVEKSNLSDELLFDTYYMQGVANLQLGNNQSAKKNFESAIETYPERIYPYQKLAEIFQDENDVGLLISTLEKGILNVPESIEKKKLLNRLGSFYRQINRLKDSIITYNKILEITPDDANAFVEIAINHYKLYEYSNAIKKLKEALVIDFENVSAKNLLRKIDLIQKKGRPLKKDLYVPQLKEDISFDNLLTSLPQELQNIYNKVAKLNDYSREKFNSKFKTIMGGKTSTSTKQKLLRELSTYAYSGSDLENFLTSIILYLLDTNHILIKQLGATTKWSSKSVIFDQLLEHNMAILKLTYFCETLPANILNNFTFQKLPQEILKRINKYTIISKEVVYLCIRLFDFSANLIRSLLSISKLFLKLVVDEIISLYNVDLDKVIRFSEIDWKNEHRVNFSLLLLTSNKYINPEGRRQVLQYFLNIDDEKLTEKSRSTLGLISSLGDSYFIYNDEESSTSEKSTYYSKLLTDILSFESLIDSHFQRTPYRSIVKNTFNAFEKLLKTETKKSILLPDLLIDLITQSCPLKEEAVIVFRITNSGLGPANDLKIIFNECDDFTLVDSEVFVGLLSSKESKEIEIKMNPIKDGEYKISGQLYFSNLDNKSDKVLFEDIISFYSIQDYHPIESPYITGPPVKSSEMFYGRKEIMENIFNKLRGIYQDNVLVLYGQRRTGKSSIIYQIQNNKDVDFQRHYIPILIDMQGLKSANTSRLCRKIYEKIHSEIERRTKKTKLDVYYDFKDDPIGDIDDFLDHLNQKFPDNKILLLFDEFEGLLESIREKRVEQHFLDNLRSWMQHKENLSFIIVGADQLRNMMQDYASILFNIAQFIQICHLNQDEAKDLILLPLKNQLQFDELAVNKILTLSGCNAYYIQLICAALVERMNLVFRNRVTLIDINKTISQKITVFGNYFNHLWEKANNLEKIIISIIAQHIDIENDIVSFYDIKKSISNQSSSDITDSQVISSLRKLVEREILLSEESGNVKYYRFCIDLFRIRVKETYGIQDVFREYTTHE